MIRPADMPGVAFGDATDGDPRRDEAVQNRMSTSLGISGGWAWMRQVHGASVVEANAPGEMGEADAAFTTVRGLAIAVATADCFPVVLQADRGVGVAHAGWRGVAAGVVQAL